MKFIIKILFLVLLPVYGIGQTTFSKIISNYPLDPETAWVVAEAPDGYIVVSWGECLGQDVVICGVVSKLDKNGNVVWFKQLDFYPNPSSSLIIKNDKIYICGGTNQGEIQVVLHCLDLDGNTLWNKSYGEPNKFDFGAAMVFTSDNHIIICGTRYPDEAGQPLRIVYIVKTDLDGNLIEEYIYDFQNNQSLGWSIIETKDHQTVFSFDACPTSCFTDFTGGVASIDSIGNQTWYLELPLSFQPDRPTVIQADSFMLIVNWHTMTSLPNHDLTPPTLFYLSLAGEVQDSLVFENQSLKKIEDIESIWENGMVGCGSNFIDYLTNPDPDPGGWVFRVNTSKQVLWERTYADSSFQASADRLQSIIPTSDGGYIAVGRIVNNMTGVVEAHNWILKLDSLGCLEPGCGETEYLTDTKEATFINGRDILIYPNPATDYVNIQLPINYTKDNMSAFIVSINGKTLKKIDIVSRETRLTLPKVTTGIYFVIITKGNEIIVSKRFQIIN